VKFRVWPQVEEEERCGLLRILHLGGHLGYEALALDSDGGMKEKVQGTEDDAAEGWPKRE